MRFPVPSTRTLAVLAWVVGLLVLGLVAYLLLSLSRLGGDYDQLEERADTGRADRADLREDLTEQQAALDKANRRLINAGEQPVTEPDLPQQGEQGLPGLRGLSCVEELGLTACQGPRGATGRQGKGGQDGEDGRTVVGPQGEPGESVTGPQGPPGESITGPPGPKGDTGPAGANGAPGKDGRGITAVRCVDGVFVVDYSDGTSQTVEGSQCTVLPPGQS